MPQVLTHGLVASGGVFLRVERLEVRGYLRQILATGVDSLADSTEAGTLCTLIAAHRCRAVVGVRPFDVRTCAVRVGGGSLAVRTDQVVAVRVAVLFLRLRQRAFHVIDCRVPFYNCHKCSAFAEQTVLRTDRPLRC